MLKIIATPNLTQLSKNLQALKEQKQQLEALYKQAQVELLNDPVMQQAMHNEMNTVNEKGTSLTGTVELYDTDGNLLVAIQKVGWDMKISQPASRKYLTEHPEAAVFLDVVIKPKVRPLLQAATYDEALADELGVAYTESTPYVKVL